MNRKETVGATAYKASQDSTRYDPLEVGYALTDDVMVELHKCAEAHEKLTTENEFCLVLVRATDPLIKGVVRHKYYAYLYLPMPRPNQSVYLYNKTSQKIRRLWSLPSAIVMSKISDMTYVSPQWQQTKGWCDAFFTGWQTQGDKVVNTLPTYFYEFIRHQHNINMPSESEYLNAHREELIKAGCKQIDSSVSDAFDFSKININQIVDSDKTITK